MMKARAMLLATLLVSLPAWPASVVVRDAWIREAPPGATVLAGYMVLANTGEQTQSLVSARAEGFERVELHETVLEDGRASMRPVTALTLPARGEVALAPGGRHLMLIRPRRPLRAGAQVPLELRFADGAVVRVTVPVEAARPESHHHH